jgi:hypothetical protein
MEKVRAVQACGAEPEDGRAEGRRVIRGNYDVLGAASPRDCLIFTPLQHSLCRGSGYSPLSRGQKKQDRARLTQGAVKDVAHWQYAVTALPIRPIWPIGRSPAAKLHADSSMSSCGATHSHGGRSAGTPGAFECRGYTTVCANRRTLHC